MIASKCQRCGGQLYDDYGDLVCLQCGSRILTGHVPGDRVDAKPWADPQGRGKRLDRQQ